FRPGWPAERRARPGARGNDGRPGGRDFCRARGDRQDDRAALLIRAFVAEPRLGPASYRQMAATFRRDNSQERSMAFYNDFILLRVCDLAMRNKQLLPFRERVIGAVEASAGS